MKPKTELEKEIEDSKKREKEFDKDKLEYVATFERGKQVGLEKGAFITAKNIFEDFEKVRLSNGILLLNSLSLESQVIYEKLRKKYLGEEK